MMRRNHRRERDRIGVRGRTLEERESPVNSGELTDQYSAERVTQASQDQSGRVVKTGTTVLGAVGSDGVVLAADTRASLGGQFVTNQDMQKIAPVDDRTAVAFSGSVSDAQAFVQQLRTELRLYEMHNDAPASVETAATVAGDLVRRGPYRIIDLVLAGVDDRPNVYDIGQGGGVMQSEYAASGSGMQLAYGALEGAYEPSLPVEQLRTIAVDAVRNATERDTASGDGMTLATVTDEGINLETFDGIDTAVDSVSNGAAGSGTDPNGSEETGEVA